MNFRYVRPLAALLFVAVACLGLAEAQEFVQIAPLYFTMTEGGPNPLQQWLTVTSTGANFDSYVNAQTMSGGNWLQVNSGFIGTPAIVEVSVDATTLPTGTYAGQIAFVAGATKMTVAVTLTVASAPTAYFGELPPELGFVFGGGITPAPLPQAIQVTNAGTGTLNWTLVATTFVGGSWLSVSATSGTAPSTVTVSVNAGNLQPGIYTGQLLFQTERASFTVPVALTVVSGDVPMFDQIPALNFTMPVGGPNPLAQLFTVTSTGPGVFSYVSRATMSGGSWLTLSIGYIGTPAVVEVGVNAMSLPAGTYTGQIEFVDGTTTMTIPVNLTVASPPTAFLGDMPTELGFVFGGGIATEPLPQTIQIINGGSGTLNWTVATRTFGGGNWLSVSASSGTAPSILTVSVNTQNLQPGVYTGQILLQAQSGNASIPVTLTVVSAPSGMFDQVPAMSFTVPVGGPNPLPQAFMVTSTGPNFYSYLNSETMSGGSWLTLSPGYIGTPSLVEASVNAMSLPAGTYTGQIGFVAGTTTMTVPVTLTVEPAPVLADLPSELAFVFGGGIATPPLPQAIQITNAGAGTLNWTAAASTFGGGDWLSVSASSGTAPSTLTVSVNTHNLQPGVYTGQILLQAQSGNASVPVTLTVVSPPNPMFNQIQPLNFSMPAGGQNPGPQSVSVVSTGPGFYAYLGTETMSGGTWLFLSTGFIGTPATVTVNVDGSSLPAGVYGGQIDFVAGTTMMTVPVTLTITGGPSISAGGVVNVASYASGRAVAPGSIAAVFGSFLLNSAAGATSLPLPLNLAGLSMTFSGGLQTPLFYASGGQVNIQVPWELTGQTQAALSVTSSGQTSPAQTVDLAPYAPGIFTTNSQGAGQGAILDSGFRLVDASNPATAGSTYIQIFCTGLGTVTNQPADGAPSPANPLAETTATPTVTIGGVEAPVQFSGLTPGLVGVYQVNVQVPAGAPAGNAAPVVISIGGAASNTATIAVSVSE